jgi:CTP synthase (UTP-ammonia lyase)
MSKIGIIGEYDANFDPHPATSSAIEHSRAALVTDVAYEWVSTSELNDEFFERFSGLWVAPGSPYKDIAKTLRAIRFARENRVPTFGTCGGFQHMMIEYARNVLGIMDAQHAEYDPYASCLFISELECSLAGREMKLQFSEGSKVAEIYGATVATERYYCNFGMNPDYLEQIKSGPLQIVGSDCEGEVRVIEHPDHPFFIGTLFVPQMLSMPDHPHPLVSAFVAEVAKTVGTQHGSEASREFCN